MQRISARGSMEKTDSSKSNVKSNPLRQSTPAQGPKVLSTREQFLAEPGAIVVMLLQHSIFRLFNGDSRTLGSHNCSLTRCNDDLRAFALKGFVSRWYAPGTFLSYLSGVLALGKCRCKAPAQYIMSGLRMDHAMPPGEYPGHKQTLLRQGFLQ